MSDYRTVKAATWTNGELLRLPWHARMLFLYLVTAGADDEGRFHADAVALLRNAFSPIDGVTVADVEADMATLCDLGMVVLYGERWGFLTGWYRHQYIEPKLRSVSHIPPPPVSVNSWEAADKALAAYKAHSGKGRVYYRDAVTWWSQQVEGEDASQSLSEDFATSSRTVREEFAIERKGKERKYIPPPVPGGVLGGGTFDAVNSGENGSFVGNADVSDEGGGGVEEQSFMPHAEEHLFLLPEAGTEDRNNGRQRPKRRSRPAAYKARSEEEMDADEAQMRDLLTAAGLGAETDLLLQTMANVAASGKVSQLKALRTMQLLLYSAQSFGVEATREGIMAAVRKEAGAEYAETVARNRWQREERDNAE